MRTASVVVVGLLAATGWAAPKTVIVAGDCADPALISGAKDFRDTASQLLGVQLMDPESVLDIVRPRPTRSVQDIERQVESAKALFYGGQGDRALELVERALAELERASPEAKPWAVTQAALVLQALVQKNLEHPREMNEAFRRLARLDPAFKLDPDAHPPSAIAALEAVKKDLARARKSSLLVRIDTGPAALVFIDGQPLGQTPLKVELAPGTYRVSLTAPGMVSFPHRVEVPRDTKLSVDLAFEGALGLQAPLCFSNADDGAALKLGQLVTADRVIVLRNTAKQGAPPVITGALFVLATGQQERSASVPPESLARLATFLVTGQEQVGVQPTGAAKSAEVPRAEPVKLEPAAAVVDPRQPTFVSSGMSTGRVTSFVLLGVGAAAALAGVILYAAGEDDRARLIGITRADGKLPFPALPVGQEAIRLMPQVDGNAVLSFSLLGGGGGAILAGILGAVLFPSGNASVSVSPQASGGSVQLGGRF